MSQETFENLLRLVGPLVTKAKKVVREPLSVAERLSLTIHFLAYGDMQLSFDVFLQWHCQVISSIVCDTCSSVWEALHSTNLRVPKTRANWKKVANQFQDFSSCDRSDSWETCHHKMSFKKWF